MGDIITYRGTRTQLRQELARLPAVLAGKRVDTGGASAELLTLLGVGLLSRIEQDFVTKSRGGTGEDGITWPPLKRETIAQRRAGPGDLKGVGGKRTRGLLTTTQDKRWRKIYGTRLARFVMQGVEYRAAQAHAAQIAWATLKAEGAQTKLAVLGGRQVDILRDTGELFASLAPGVESTPSGAEGQVFRVGAGQVTVGTNKKPWHHRGTKKLPARRLWPVDGKLPDSWWRHLLGIAQRGVARIAARLLEE